MEPGIYTLTSEDYFASPGVSKSGLWTLYKKSPYHFRFGERKETAAQRFGTASHTAVLEPNLFEPRYMRGPEDRRGNKWAASVEIAAANGKACLTEKEYDYALRLRDAVQRHPLVQQLTAGTPAIEQSAYWIDEATGELCRCRPDLHNHDLRLMADLKSCADAGAYKWSKAALDYGYHVQDPWYADGWTAAGGGDVDGFVFITVEKEPPFAVAIYELEPRAQAEGRAIARTALDTYHACRTAEDGLPEALVASAWPGYATSVQRLDLPRFGFNHTDAADFEDEQEEAA